jgi:uncharacterized membrane protein
MTWLQRYRLRHYLMSSIWVLPVLSILLALAVVRSFIALDDALGWESRIHVDAAQNILGTMASAMFTFIVFVSSALLVAVQLASSTLTPRIIAIVFRDPITKIALMVFVFTFTFTLGALVRVSGSVPVITAHLAAYSSLASIGVFLLMIDHVGKALRPSGALWAVASLGRRVIASVYPQRITDKRGATLTTTAFLEGEPNRTLPSQKDGVVLAFDIPGLVSVAQRHDCVIELVPQVGDFVAFGDPMFRIFHGGESLTTELLGQSVAVGQERTLEQDPTYAFRIIVDIANKGLSPAINDPTTAVLALDQIHHLLRDVGQRRLDDERVRDQEGKIRLVYRTPDWEDFVRLAVTEIRQYGGTSIQIARRLRAMLENLIQTLPEERTVLLHQELALVHRAAERFFAEPEDRALAEVSDSQGVGGKNVASRKSKPAKEGTPP